MQMSSQKGERAAAKTLVLAAKKHVAEQRISTPELSPATPRVIHTKSSATRRTQSISSNRDSGTPKVRCCLGLFISSDHLLQFAPVDVVRVLLQSLKK